MELLILALVLVVVVLDVALLSRWSPSETEADPVEAPASSPASDGLSPLDEGPRCRRCATVLDVSTYRYCVDCV